MHLWEALADRYRDNPWVAGYNPVNEPADADGDTIGPFYRRLEAAIRAVDPDHILFLDGNRYSTQFDQLGDPLPNCVYTAHDYALPGFVDGGAVPGRRAAASTSTATAIEETFLARTAVHAGDRHARSGSASSARSTPATRTATSSGTACSRTSSTSTDRHDASWALWTYKDIGLQGVVTADPAPPTCGASPRCSRRRRGSASTPGGRRTPACGTSSSPIERLFAEEFPDFEPYPWGAQRWIHGHVRHVMLAEAMVDEFAGAFAGVAPDEARDLADAFALPNACTRSRLADIIRSAAR